MSHTPKTSTNVRDTAWADARIASQQWFGSVPVVGGVIGIAAMLLGCGSSATPSLQGAEARGAALTRELGCAACHGGVGRDAEVGPSWVGSWGDEIELSNGDTLLFDAAYVEASVRNPDRHRRLGVWPRMPEYRDDQLTGAELRDIVAYLKAIG